MRVKLSQSSGQHNHLPLAESVLNRMQYVDLPPFEPPNHEHKEESNNEPLEMQHIEIIGDVH